MSIKALNDVVFVFLDEVKTTTASGIFLGGSVDTKVTGTVISVGSEVKNVAVNDKVLLAALTYYTPTIDGIKYNVCREKEVLAVLG